MATLSDQWWESCVRALDLHDVLPADSEILADVLDDTLDAVAARPAEISSANTPCTAEAAMRRYFVRAAWERVFRARWEQRTANEIREPVRKAIRAKLSGYLVRVNEDAGWDPGLWDLGSVLEDANADEHDFALCLSSFVISRQGDAKADLEREQGEAAAERQSAVRLHAAEPGATGTAD